jgi:hypothetical protein
VVAKHSINDGHHINFKDITVPAKMAGYMDHTVGGATEIWLHPNNFN